MVYLWFYLLITFYYVQLISYWKNTEARSFTTNQIFQHIQMLGMLAHICLFCQRQINNNPSRTMAFGQPLHFYTRICSVDIKW